MRGQPPSTGAGVAAAAAVAAGFAPVVRPASARAAGAWLRRPAGLAVAHRGERSAPSAAEADSPRRRRPQPRWWRLRDLHRSEPLKVSLPGPRLRQQPRARARKIGRWTRIPPAPPALGRGEHHRFAPPPLVSDNRNTLDAIAVLHVERRESFHSVLRLPSPRSPRARTAAGPDRYARISAAELLYWHRSKSATRSMADAYSRR